MTTLRTHWIAGCLLLALLLAGWQISRNIRQRHSYENRIAALAADSVRRGAAAAVRVDAETVWVHVAARAAAVQRAARVARVLADTARARAGAAPDTCAPLVDAYESALRGHEHWIDTLTQQRDAAVLAAGLFRRADSLSTTRADSLASALRRLTPPRRGILPKYGIGAAVGVNPVTGRPGAVVGLTLNWTF